MPNDFTMIVHQDPACGLLLAPGDLLAAGPMQLEGLADPASSSGVTSHHATVVTTGDRDAAYSELYSEREAIEQRRGEISKPVIACDRQLLPKYIGYALLCGTTQASFAAETAPTPMSCRGRGRGRGRGRKRRCESKSKSTYLKCARPQGSVPFFEFVMPSFESCAEP